MLFPLQQLHRGQRYAGSRFASISGRVLRMSAGVAPPRRAVATAYCMFARPTGECASVEQTSVIPAADGVPDVLGAEVEADRQPVDLDRDIVLERDLEDPVEVDARSRAGG